MKHNHLFTFCTAVIVAWVLGTCAFVYFWPHMFYNTARRAVVQRGLGIKPGGIPVNTLYAMPALASPSLSKSVWVRTGNRDTLYTVGGLDLGKGPEILHVPDMAGRYYSIEFVDPWLDIFADIGRRTTGTRAGDYLISGPYWKGSSARGGDKNSSLRATRSCSSDECSWKEIATSRPPTANLRSRCTVDVSEQLTISTTQNLFPDVRSSENRGFGLHA